MGTQGRRKPSAGGMGRLSEEGAIYCSAGFERRVRNGNMDVIWWGEGAWREVRAVLLKFPIFSPFTGTILLSSFPSSDSLLKKLRTSKRALYCCYKLFFIFCF